jgi:hypothetical protein
MQFVAALVFCRRLAESDVTVSASFTCVLIDYIGGITTRLYLATSSTALAFLTNMSEKCKYT